MYKIEIGQKIKGRYRITSRVARGDSAEIFEVVDTENRNLCAIKFLSEELLNDQDSIAKFKHETDILSKLQNENIITVYDYGDYYDRPFIVLEYIRGQTLGDKIQLRSGISFLTACEIMLNICNALSYIHLKGIVHRDIRPDNIYYLNDSEIKIANFSIAIDLTNKRPIDLLYKGNANYQAPEISQGYEASYLSDIYSLGITFFEILTFKLPFVSNANYTIEQKHLFEEIPLEPLRMFPEEISKIIIKATMKNPNERYQSVNEMYDDISNIIFNKKKLVKKKNFFSRIFGLKEN